VSGPRLATLTVALTLLATSALANPWAGQGPQPPEPAVPQATPRQDDSPGATPWGRGPRPAESARSVGAGGPGQSLFTVIAPIQRKLNQTLARELREIRQTGSPAALATVGLVAFVYGVLHAAGPGHGKLVVSAYFVSGAARPLAGFLVGALVSGLQVVSALGLVSVLAFGLGERGLGVMNRAVTLEVASYALIVAIGLVMLVRALSGHHAHAEAGPDGRRTGGGLVIAAGLTPCASAIILLLFALANGVFLVGIVASAVMALGMTITVSLVGVLTIVGRRTLLGLARRRPRALTYLSRGLAVAGSALITGIGALFLADAWNRLG
jgi:ABC-type nickel/cobalt efflux system permease component RcnA